MSDKHRHLSTYSIEDPYNPVLIDSLSWIFNSNYDGILRMTGNEEFLCLYIDHRRDDLPAEVTRPLAYYDLAMPASN